MLCSMTLIVDTWQQYDCMQFLFSFLYFAMPLQRLIICCSKIALASYVCGNVCSWHLGHPCFSLFAYGQCVFLCMSNINSWMKIIYLVQLTSLNYGFYNYFSSLKWWLFVQILSCLPRCSENLKSRSSCHLLSDILKRQYAVPWVGN